MTQADVFKTLEKLPAICASVSLTDGTPIMIRRGVSGYYPAPPNLDVDGFNTRRGVSAAQRLAMEIGSMFGWEVPGADPDQHNARHHQAAKRRRRRDRDSETPDDTPAIEWNGFDRPGDY